MPLTELHHRIAAIALRAATRHGFALGGGNALIAHGVIARPTRDVDLFTNQVKGVAAAANAVETALRREGFTVHREDQAADLAETFPGMEDELADWVLTAPDSGQAALQLGHFDRTHDPVPMDVGPVLHLEDVAGNKICALASRVEPRDYVDTAALLERWTPAELIGLALRLDPGLDDRDLADVARRLDRMPDEAFTPYRLAKHDVALLRERFGAWPRDASTASSTRHGMLSE